MQLLGLISDTHDNIQNIQNAIISFNDKHVRVVIHAGEMVSPETVKVFDGMKLIGVLGNNDLEVRELISAFDKIGGELRGEFCEIEQDKLVFVAWPVSIHYLHNRLLLFKIVIVQTISPCHTRRYKSQIK